MLGFSALRCTAIGLAALTVLARSARRRRVGTRRDGPIWTLLLATRVRHAQGRAPRRVAALGAALVAARVRRSRRPTGSRVTAPRPAGTMALPGDAAPLRFYNDPDTGACLIHDPHRQTLSAVLAVSHSAYVLLAPSDQVTSGVGLGARHRVARPDGHVLGDPGTGVDDSRPRHEGRPVVRGARHAPRRLGERASTEPCSPSRRSDRPRIARRSPSPST